MPRLLLIGRDSAGWKTIDRLVDQGDMPVMKGLIERGPGNDLTCLHTTPAPMRLRQSSVVGWNKRSGSTRRRSGVDLKLLNCPECTSRNGGSASLDPPYNGVLGGSERVASTDSNALSAIPERYGCLQAAAQVAVDSAIRAQNRV
jgi:hypothetical protein